MKKTPSKRKASLPPGIVPYKGANTKLKRWHQEFGEPDGLAHAGVNTRMRQAAGAKK